MIKIAPSLLAADFSKLGSEISEIEKGGAGYLHLDIMDGVFVPNISYGIPVIQSIRKISRLFFDTHLMITEPVRYITQFRKAGADLITVHLEACGDVASTLAKIRESGAKAGLSLKPGTPVESVFPYLPLCDLVLVMTVEPGFGGQSFMADMVPKVKALRAEREKLRLNYEIEVDGGISGENSGLLIEAGVDVLVAGSSVFGMADRAEAIKRIRTGL